MQTLNLKKTLLGEILVKKNIISRDQLILALAEQGTSRKRLGQILIEKRVLTFDELDHFLLEQDILNQDPTLLGSMLVIRGIITPQQLHSVLAEQEYSHRRLGEILIARRLLSFDQLDDLLLLQRVERSRNSESQFVIRL
ncbi:hypothetical protein BST81_01115 [Leptolyngbya sp. 'hensonii']|uniref:hypothetical protein n=1 Tax=Leptolyngbya sp. 'hensonii' TaxID=1922337 RepID=UPI0009500043|nr:hypothetical protein [Leptolyngbya sp. 'hensonii']OLP20363.1 hypothetical protein BST81_01115 [Leptolyngbya sp. 'hensonii']